MEIAMANNVDLDVDIKQVISQLEEWIEGQRSIERIEYIPISDIFRRDVKGTNGKTYLYNYWMFYGTEEELENLQAESKSKLNPS